MNDFWVDSLDTHSKWTMVFAHGAGAPMDSDWMNEVAHRLQTLAQVVRFEFPYMRKRRVDGKRRPPDRAETLDTHFINVVARVREELLNGNKLVLAGKSMGARVATRIAERVGAQGVVCFGYPFHPPGKPERLRTAHLKAIATPVLVCQGERDRFGTRDEVPNFELSNAVEFHWSLDGDHSLKPRKRSGRTLEQNLDDACNEVGSFLQRLNNND